MKISIYIITLFLSQFSFCQTNESEEIFWDLINHNLYQKKSTKTGYVKKVDSALMTYHLEKFKKDTSLTYFNFKSNGVNKIELTIEEKQFLVNELYKSIDYNWNLSNEKDLIEVKHSNIKEFLEEDDNHKLKIISKPIFIRNKEFALVFNVHLRSKQPFGYVNLTFFKKENGTWEFWIPLIIAAF